MAKLLEKVLGEVSRLSVQDRQALAEFLQAELAKGYDSDSAAEKEIFSNLSLAMAMRGMESENGPEYSDSDLKESFS